MATMAENNANIPRPALATPDVAPNYVPHVPEPATAAVIIPAEQFFTQDQTPEPAPEPEPEDAPESEPSSMDELDAAAVELYNVITDTAALAPFAEALQGYIAAQVQHAQALTDAVRIVGQQQQWLVDTVGPAMGQVTAVMSGGGGPLGAMLRKMTGMKGGVGNGGNPTGDPGIAG